MIPFLFILVGFFSFQDFVLANSALNVTKVTPQYWRATFAKPPLNLWAADQFSAFSSLVNDLEKDQDVQVVVFDSAAKEYFIAHYDLVNGSTTPPNATTIFASDVRRLATMPVVSIAQVQGRVRGVGDEFIMACDLRFASREKAVFGQIEVGFGAVPGSGGMDWLPRVVGRSRALEIILSSNDFDATTAELYGWINRAVPDRQLASFVDKFARRIAGFDKKALSVAKTIINKRSIFPTEAELIESSKSFGDWQNSPTVKERMDKLLKMGLQTDGYTERNLGKVLGELNIHA